MVAAADPLLIDGGSTPGMRARGIENPLAIVEGLLGLANFRLTQLISASCSTRSATPF
jgi:hypothetical protein